MAIDPERALERAEELLRRHVKSKAARDAEKRAKGRARAEALRGAVARVGRAAVVGGTGLGATVAYGAAVAPVGAMGLTAAVTGTAIAAAAALLWPNRRAPAPPPELADLRVLADEREAWLVATRRDLPARAAPAIDSILTCLHEQQQLYAEAGGSPAAGDARRLIGDHLPRLVDSYLAVPSSTRRASPDIDRRFIESLHLVAGEFQRIGQELSRDRLTSFEVEKRFLESRYKDV